MSTQPRGFSIRFFLPDGTPDGMKIVEKSNWIGRAIVCPRGKFADLRGRSEFKKTGVYLLLGQTNPDDLPTVYIGEGDPVGDRLVQHQKAKDFWTSVVFFTSKDDNLNTAHVQYLEARLIGLATAAKRCDLENGNSPALPSMSEADIAEMEEFLAQMLLIYPALGISVFQKPSEPPGTEFLYLTSKGIRATGYEASDGFVVRAGSQAAKTAVPSTPPAAVNRRKTLLAQRLFVASGEHLKLTQDYTFDSPSFAAKVMLGRSVNGRTEWKDEHGRTLKEIQTAAAAAGATT